MITSFKGKYDFLSNFFPAVVEWENREYPTLEHGYVLAKSGIDFSDAEDAYQNYIDLTPGKVKRLGKGFDSKEWRISRLAVMGYLLRQKFFKGSELAEKLLDTGDVELVEGNTWGDTFWGVCDGKGDNHLGRLLMEIRDELRD